MNDQNNRDAFEQFLTDETDKHQLFASDAVWANISKQVQKEKSWPALTIVAFFIVIGLSVATILNYPPDNILAKAHYNDSVQIAHQKEAAAIIASKAKDDDLESRISSQKITAKTFAEIEKHQQAVALAAVTPTVSVVDVKVKPEVAVTEKVRKPLAVKENVLANNGSPFTKEETLPLAMAAITDEVANTTNTDIAKSDDKIGESDANEGVTDNVYKDYFAALIKKKATKKSTRWTYDIYATPSKSYRNLEDDKVRNLYTTTSIPNANNTNTASLSNAVRHKPALGSEAGIAIGYNLTTKLTVKAGLQFNIRQYYIDAYQTFGIATIAIVQNNRLDSLSFYTRFGSSGNSYSETKLDNRLYQLSIPLGLEWTAFEGKKLGLNLGASVQPTFTLNKNVYLISTDYKYYANGASFFRKWNINTAVNINFSYKINNGSKLYFGPQVRYQHLPTYNDAYPIKEYRLDYGVKIGFIKGF